MQLKHVSEPLVAENPTNPAEPDSIGAEDYDDGLLQTAIPIMIAAYGVALGIATFTFWRSGEALLSLAICMVYVVMFFGVPIVMARIRNARDARWKRRHPAANKDRVNVFSGTLGRTEALLQIIIVPLGVAVAFAAFAVIWLNVGP
ncbi:MAG: hypothetical protein AB7O43_04530 [Hyphomicrobiaceae bacterium]